MPRHIRQVLSWFMERLDAVVLVNGTAQGQPADVSVTWMSGKHTLQRTSMMVLPTCTESPVFSGIGVVTRRPLT